jgi:site-specific DNA-methyltransferase (adenine-specific)
MIKLYNADCRNELARIFEGGGDFCVVTDPPFNMGYHYNTYKDNMNESEYIKMLGDILRRAPSAVIHYPEALYKIALEIGSAPERVVSWVYNSNTQKQHRDVAFFGIKPDFSKVRQPYKNPNDKRIQKRIAEGKTGAKLYDWWNVNQVKNVSKEKTAHPCQMPLEIMLNIVGILPENVVIIDPFMGSGTTGVACKKLGRDFIGIEIDAQYYAIAEQRILTA